MKKSIMMCLLGIISFVFAFFINEKSSENEFNLLGVNINHFLTYFGGSTLLYVFFLCIILFLNRKKENNYKVSEIEPLIFILTFIGTVWLSWGEEFKQSKINFLDGFHELSIKNSHNFLDVFSDLLGWAFFVFLISSINIISYVLKNNK